MKYRIIAITVLASIVALVATGATLVTAGSKRPQGSPRLDAERLIGLQHGNTPGVATCPVSQQAVEQTQLRGVGGTLAHAYLDGPGAGQRAQLLAEVVVHEKPLKKGVFGSHPEVDEALGKHATVGTWNMKLHPNAGSESIVLDHALNWNWTIPKGHYVTLCIWVNNNQHPRYNWESQLTLVTNKDMRTVRYRPICDCDVPQALAQIDNPAPVAEVKPAPTGKVVVPKNSVGSAEIEDRSIHLKDLAPHARAGLIRSARKKSGSGQDLAAFKSCVNQYLNELDGFLKDSRKSAPDAPSCS